MPTKPTKSTKKQPDAIPIISEVYEKALGEYRDALAQMQAGSFEAARAIFERVATTYTDETSLVERSRMYSRFCARKLAPANPDPQTADELFYQAVVNSNNGEADEAMRLLDRALQLEPESARLFYARASALAIKGDAEAAVHDLRRAIAADPKVRFQAGNDPDFESIREEPAFIDIIEPTPTGV